MFKNENVADENQIGGLPRKIRLASEYRQSGAAKDQAFIRRAGLNHDQQEGIIMQILGTILLVIGALVAFIYGIILLIKAFQTSVLWGLGYLFVPFVALIFVIVHWDVAKQPFLYSLLGVAIMFIGIALVPESALNANDIQSLQ